MNNLIAIALAPAIFLIFVIWRIDKLEREPMSLIIKVMIFGAVSSVLAYFLEVALDSPIEQMFQNDYSTYLIADNFVGVALVEEFVKMLVIIWFIWRSPKFDCLFDGVVYGAASSLGFAALENIAYSISYGFSTAIVRAFTAVPGHLIFGVFMGALISIAKMYKYEGKNASKAIAFISALIVPMILHGFYDYLLSDPFSSASLIWYAYFAIIVVAAAILIVNMARHDRYITPKG